MDISRIRGVMDVEKLQDATVTIVGSGGAADLIAALARCGVGTFKIIDPDRVGVANIARQGHHADEIGRLKVEAVAAMIHRINRDARIICLPLNFLEMTDEEIDSQLGDSDLFIFATDHFDAQAR